MVESFAFATEDYVVAKAHAMHSKQRRKRKPFHNAFGRRTRSSRTRLEAVTSRLYQSHFNNSHRNSGVAVASAQGESTPDDLPDLVGSDSADDLPDLVSNDSAD